MKPVLKTFLALGLLSCGLMATAQELAPATASVPADVQAVRPDPMDPDAPAIHGRAERNAFLAHAATTHEALMQEVKSDPAVMDRYMRHFGMTQEQVINYFDTLRADTIKEDAVYLVYNVPESGELRAREIYYRKGTPVWVDPTGALVLKMSCGNPLTRGTDKAPADLAPVTEIEPVVSVSSTAPITGTTEGTPMTSLVPADVPAATEVPAADAPAAITAGGSSFNSAWLLLPAAALGIIAIDHNNNGGGGIIGGCGSTGTGSDGSGGMTTGGSGSGSNCCASGTNGGSSGTQCVPEPFSTGLIVLGLGGVVARKFRKK